MKKKQITMVVILFIVGSLVASVWGGLASRQRTISDQSKLITELLKEQAVREVEVSIWETANAIFYHMIDPSAMSHEEYKKQVDDVNKYMSEYANFVTTTEEVEAIAKFKTRWDDMISKAEQLLTLRAEMQALHKTIWASVHEDSHMLRHESSMALSQDIQQCEEKEKLLWLLRSLMWESSSQVCCMAYQPSETVKTHLESTLEHAEMTWQSYRKLGISSHEQVFVDTFEAQWQQYASMVHKTIEMITELHQEYLSFWEATHALDDVVDFDIQESMKQTQKLIIGEKSL